MTQPAQAGSTPDAELQGTEREFDALYFDTQPLRASAWPRLRAGAVTIITLARENNISVCLPEPVEAELRAQFTRAFTEADQKISQALRDMESVFRRVDAQPEETTRRPTVEAALAAYDRAVNTIRGAHGLVQIGRSARVLDEYFDLAISQTAPFDVQGRGFKDTVILMSVIDDVLRRRRPGLLVTSDRDFNGGEDIAARLGAQLIVRTAEASIDILRRRLAFTARVTYARAERDALTLLGAHRSQLIRFVEGNLEVSADLLASPAEQLLGFRGVEIQAIKDVQSDPAFSVLGKGQRAKLTFRISVALIAQVMPIPETIRSSGMVKVGDSIPPRTDQDRLVNLLVAHEIANSQGPKNVWQMIEVDAEATRTPDGFEDLTFLAVRMSDRGFWADLLAVTRAQ